MSKPFKSYTKLEIITLLRDRLPTNMLCSFPYVGLKPDMEV